MILHNVLTLSSSNNLRPSMSEMSVFFCVCDERISIHLISNGEVKSIISWLNVSFLCLRWYPCKLGWLIRVCWFIIIIIMMMMMMIIMIIIIIIIIIQSLSRQVPVSQTLEFLSIINKIHSKTIIKFCGPKIGGCDRIFMKNFIIDVSLNKKVPTKFWKLFGFGSGQ